MQGTHMVMGGILLLKAGTGEVAYRYSERRFGDSAPADEVRAVCPDRRLLVAQLSGRTPALEAIRLAEAH